jgi:hypothetical protein
MFNIVRIIIHGFRTEAGKDTSKRDFRRAVKKAPARAVLPKPDFHAAAP